MIECVVYFSKPVFLLIVLWCVPQVPLHAMGSAKRSRHGRVGTLRPFVALPNRPPPPLVCFKAS